MGCAQAKAVFIAWRAPPIPNRLPECAHLQQYPSIQAGTTPGNVYPLLGQQEQLSQLSNTLVRFLKKHMNILLPVSGRSLK